ncbi:MAG: TonB-dependent receptor [Candidatus Reddybacter sp.]
MSYVGKIKPLTAAILAASSVGFTSMALGADKDNTETGATVSAIDGDEVKRGRARGAAAVLMEEVVTQARKKSSAEEVQDVPIAMTAYSGEQLEALQMRNINDLTYSMPNVALDAVGTSKGTANFTIRGLGINSSIPSVDPTVGVFVDGMYYGMSWGVIMDTFDLEGIEVLRGPQGLLFGRNVTGGAVSMRTRRPSHEYAMRAKASVTDDNDQVYALSVTGSLIKDVLAGKMAVYYRDDNGYFENKGTNNDNFGESETYLIRPAVTWTPTEDLELMFTYERGELEGDGATSKNLANPALDDFELDLDEEGFNKARWNHIIWETNYDVSFGNGTITNIVAYRDFEQSNLADIDSASITAFNLGGRTEQDQFSNELRFAGTFMDDKLDLTVGTFYFTQNQSYVETRPVQMQTFGGNIDHKTWAVFAQGDYQLNDAWILTLGGRYSYEEKEADIARGVAGTFPCTLKPLHCTTDFTSDDDWDSFTPKFGLQWYFNENAHAYFTYTKGFRSGGYNLRNTSLTASPGPYDQEEQNAFEVGMKSEWMDGRVKFNIALFQNEIEDMQRETVFNIDLPGGGTNIVQEIRNTADATITGVEMDVQALVGENLLLNFSVGYMDGEYDKVSADLNRDGNVDGGDEALDLPRLSPWSWQAGANYDIPMANGLLSLRASWNHRNSAYWNDSNVDPLRSADILDAGIAYTTNDGKWTATLFGKNLTDDEVASTRFTVAPGALVFAPLNKGRVIGVELQYQY